MHTQDIQISPSLLAEFSAVDIQEMQLHFNEFDLRGNGSVEAGTLHEIMTTMGIDISLDKLQDMIDEVDENNSGALEFPEFLMLVRNLRRGENGVLGSFIQNSRLALEIRREFTELSQNQPKYCALRSTRGNIRRWEVDIVGPPGTPYEGGIFKLEVRFGNDYPYVAPDMFFTTRIYHLNFITLNDGRASLMFLLEKWTSESRVKDVLEKVVALFQTPNVDDMLRILAVETPLKSSNPFSVNCRYFAKQTVDLYRDDRKRYDSLAKDITRKFAIVAKID